MTANAKVNLNVKIDSELKTLVDNMFENMGITTSAAINMFFKRVAATGQLPFTPQVNNETMLAIQNINSGVNLVGPFNAVEELMADLNDKQEG
ncbi:MAG: type II toxin-antitoxin system RelB/DinJ family antitoxin [Lactobacillaceae bacterium]|nr:type II toxin-antitoxin system RelB/DinJ family antitoxin [Lactobacillaceae bacterium]